MNCPACNNRLETIQVENLSVDICSHHCGGLWFDRFELKQVDEAHESAGEQLLDIARDPELTIDHSLKRLCPKCDNQVMMKHFMSVKREVEVDECPACGGFWLDAGELGQIRSQYATEAERTQAAETYFSDVFGSDLDRMRQEGEERKERARRIARIFRFICPSFYLPGKQKWGAF